MTRKKLLRGNIKKSSNFLFWLLRVLIPIIWIKYRFRFKYNTSKDIKRPCLILSNHQTSFDQFGVGAGFRFGINFLASDSIFRHGLQSWIMKVLGQPIPFSKGSADASAVIKMFSVIKQGGAICMFVSGNRSFFGEECTIKQGIGKLSKKLGVPIVLVKIRGGYNTKPRWKSKPNKGDMHAYVSRIIPAKELDAYTSEQLEEIIKHELYFNEFEWNATEQIEYHGRQKAEFLERALFYCPECKSLNCLGSNGNDFFCTLCDMRVQINSTGFFEKIKMAENCPDTILDWSRIQLDHVKSINYSEYIGKPLFNDKKVRLSYVIRTKKDKLLGKGQMELFGDKIRICGRDLEITKIKDMSIQSYNRLIIYYNKDEFTVDMSSCSNAVKYMICGYHFKNTALNIKNGHYGY